MSAKVFPMSGVKNSSVISLRNPHSALATLKVRPKDVVEVLLSKPGGANSQGEAWGAVEKLARASGIRVSAAPTRKNHSPSDYEEGGRTSGSEVRIRENPGVSIEELFSDARDKASGRGLWLALDNLQDPHNLGAIFRTASFFGVEGILLTQDRSAPLSSAAYDVSSGGVETVPFAWVTNLQRAFELAKDAGIWILGTSEHARGDFRKVERDRPWLLVLGNEEKGLRRLTEEACDQMCTIPVRGEVTSLNVSVAAGILISHLAPRSE
jgi:23S rRNA (guanosine2251-2'-O)-methyltransferase